MSSVSSEDRAVIDREIQIIELLLDNRFGIWQVLEWDLGKEVVFSLVLHTSKHHKPEVAVVVLVSCGYNLMLDKWSVDFLLEAVLSLVIADKDCSNDESGYEMP
jgi:hypothetical protein